MVLGNGFRRYQILYEYCCQKGLEQTTLGHKVYGGSSRLSSSSGSMHMAIWTGFNEQTSWTWTQNTDSVVADVAYDLFTSSSPGGSNEYEIMIFLANFNAGPISYTYSFDGEPTDIATVTLAGQQWCVMRFV
jgi:hypothetical protein